MIILTENIKSPKPIYYTCDTLIIKFQNSKVSKLTVKIINDLEEIEKWEETLITSYFI